MLCTIVMFDKFKKKYADFSTSKQSAYSEHVFDIFYTLFHIIRKRSVGVYAYAADRMAKFKVGSVKGLPWHPFRRLVIAEKLSVKFVSDYWIPQV